MGWTRRHTLAGLASLATAPFASHATAQAAAYPIKPVRLLVPDVALRR